MLVGVVEKLDSAVGDDKNSSDGVDVLFLSESRYSCCGARVGKPRCVKDANLPGNEFPKKLVLTTIPPLLVNS